LAESQKDAKKAAALLEEARQQAGDSVDLRVAQVQLLIRSAPKKTTPNLRPLEEPRDKFSAAEQTRLLLELADLNFQMRNIAEAKRLWQLLIHQPQHAENLQLRLFLFEAALQEGQDTEAVALVKQIRAIEGMDGVWWRFSEAQRQLRLARLGDKAAAARAEPLLKEVKVRRKTWPAVLLAEADLAQVKAENELAIARYRNAIQAGARYPGVYRKLVQLLFQQQRYQEAEQEIQLLKQQAPLSGDLGRLAVALSLFHRDFDSAEKMVRSQFDQDSTDYRDYLWLGQVLAAKGQVSQEAEDALERAVALDSVAPEPWMALVRYLLQTDRRDQAREKIEIASTKIDAKKRSLFLAQCSELLGDLDAAARHYREALQADPRSVLVWRLAAGFHARQHNTRVAEGLLRDLMNRKNDVTEQDVAWARLTLALMLASGDDARRFPEALTLVGLKLDAGGKVVAAPGTPTRLSSIDRVGQAKVLTLLNRQPLRQVAIRMLESVLQQNALNAEDQYFLAQLYLRNGPQAKWWALARELLQKVTIDSPRNSDYLAFFAQALLDHKDLLSAERAIGSLEVIEKDRKLPPGALGTVALRAQFLEASGRADSALALLQATVKRPDTSVEVALQLTWHIGRLGRLKEAIDHCERLSQKGPKEAAYRTAVGLLRGAWAVDLPADRKLVWEAQRERVATWLTEAVKQDPRSIAMRLQLADVLELQGRYDEVIEICDRVLTIEPGHLVALNNLAWLLVLRSARDELGLSLRSAKGEQALSYVNRALDLYGERPELLDTRAMTLLAVGRTAEAIADLQKVVALDPSANRYFHLARAYLLGGDYAAARAALDQALALGLTLQRLHPTEHEAYRRLLEQLKK
jgi:tetratricopeptide (TPR) repeat protein